ncbi:putative P-loop containing nucleoside triphosphate hydrolase [Helianthus annuus]|nr:putative P-loop containing nucleoside triphosphate hydrolase [Helianthus annuus]KAJ0695465.1 putative P-loop containing nucleoside triphosphate hydrolase, leucine-rich repeat domain superfamily [Helianthus annuus]KAJ0882172.1 putative P-loop containing nucleoside triphosphate hydrolase [Helianthus annuus]
MIPTQITHRTFGYRHDLIDCSLKDLKDVMDNLKSIREEIMSIQNPVKQDMIMDKKIEATGTISSTGNARVNLKASEHEELIVGFEDDALSIIDRLTGDRKKLDIISIVGMGGLGKTTLATKIFNDSLVDYHFDKRGWVTVSQAYSKRDMLLQLWVSIGKSVDDTLSEFKLCQMLYQSLKCRRYLIVIDDVWSSEAWDDVGICFPDDNTGSRVLVTTRLKEVALYASQGGFTHNIGHLSQDQSWELLCWKTFRGYECPESLIETGRRIAKKCGGLPLALVVIAGLLEKGEKRKDLWEKTAERVGAYIIDDPKGCLDTLALSYDHLPCHLKKCFLYVGAFPEGYKIQVRKLIRLWMAEGFIKKTGHRSLEEEGEDYLIGLIDRNLLIVADKRSNGGVKSCRLHDLLRQLCLKKASEENFFKKVSMPTSNVNLDSDFVSSIVKQRRLSTDCKVLCDIYLHGFATHTRSVLCFDEYQLLDFYRTTRWVHSFLLLRVLDLLNILTVSFRNIGMLIHLRYLAVWSCDTEFSLSEVNMWSLQTLIVKGKFQSFIYSPHNMVNLRHLHCDRITIPTDFSVPTSLNLQTISRLILDHRTQFLLESFSDIKKLGCSISPASSSRGLLSFAMLTHLEALNIDKYMHWSLTLAKPIRFPETLRKLTLRRLYLPWNYMSTIQQLPKLEVLKLLESSFCGHLWETGDEQFHQLKYLKLEKLNISVWEASSINFPHLRKLVVKGCGSLTEIPLELGNIYTLEHIETDYSNPHVHESVTRIQEAQRELGNCDIHVNFTRRQGRSNSSWLARNQLVL